MARAERICCIRLEKTGQVIDVKVEVCRSCGGEYGARMDILYCVVDGDGMLVGAGVAGLDAVAVAAGEDRKAGSRL